MKNLIRKANKKFFEKKYLEAFNVYTEIVRAEIFWEPILAINRMLCLKRVSAEAGVSLRELGNGSVTNPLIFPFINYKTINIFEQKNSVKKEIRAAELKAFGAAFLGPVVAKFYIELEKSIRKDGIKKLWFLSREGYFLERIFKELIREIDGCNIETEYLLCSRTLLFKLSLSKPELVYKSLEHAYKGLLKDFVIERYGFSISEYNKLLSLSSLLGNNFNRYIELPKDNSFVYEVMKEISDKYGFNLKKKLKIYLRYLEEIGFGASKLENLVDLGYAGTIQSLLTDLTGQSTSGHYFITTNAATDSSQKKYNGYLLSGVKFGDGKQLLDRSLFLETILTAPHGQVIDIEEMPDGELGFVFGKIGPTQVRFNELDLIVEGCIEYVKGIRMTNNFLDVNEVQSYYSNFVGNAQLFPEYIRSLFMVDDTISGNGFLNPIDFFKRV